MRVGWIIDRGDWGNGRIGGAELNANKLIADKPADVEIIHATPDYIPDDVDCYVIHNCYQYSAAIIPIIKNKPVYKMLHDVWHSGDGKLRQWLLSNATKTILVSPVLEEWLRWSIKTPIAHVPSAIDIVSVKPRPKNIERALWIGRIHKQKGLIEAIQWASDHHVKLDVYGFGELRYVTNPGVYKGELKPGEVCEVMANYDKFVFLPQDFDACPRVVFEAHQAGCKIITNGWQGATWWINNNPDAIKNASSLFWNEVI